MSNQIRTRKSISLEMEILNLNQFQSGKRSIEIAEEFNINEASITKMKRNGE